AELAVRTLIEATEPLPDLIVEPTGELSHPGGDAIGPARGPLLSSQRIGDLTGFALRPLSLGGTLIHPGLHPVGFVAWPDFAGGPEQQEPERVLARELPA